MSIIKDVIIINETRLRLGVDAKAGDEIDLTLLNKVDTSIIIDKINSAKDELYNNKLIEHEKRIKAENDNKILSITKDLNEEIIKLKSELDSVAKDTENKLKLEHEKELNKLKNLLTEEKVKLESFKEKYKTDIESAKKEKEYELLSKIQELENKISNKENEIETIKKTSETDKQLALKETEAELNEKIKELEFELNNLKLQRSTLNVKMQGEKLEGWCDSEYASYSVSGFENCVWIKDNKSVREDDEARGTKADYIFKVYASKDKKEEELLTSVVLEMKSENPLSKTKQKNSQFYNKLDLDRKKKGAEYALLVSELEWEQENDVPIRRIQEYDKMYLVRPPYFMNLLSIINSLAMKYKEVLVETNKKQLKFKDRQDIIDEFEKLKEDILEKSIARLEKETEQVINNADKIIKLSNQIKDSADKIANSILRTMKNKINDFNINKISKKIEKTESLVYLD